MSFKIRQAHLQEYTAKQVLDLLPFYSKDDKVLVMDGDILAFKISSVCEYKYLYTHKVTKSEYKAKSKTEFKTFLLENEECGSIEDYECIFQQEAQPISYAARTAKQSINNIMEYLSCNKIEIYLGGSKNFRLDLPLPSQYKSSRTDQPKPLLLNPLKDYLIEHQGAKKIKGVEADDIVQMRMRDLSLQGVDSILWTIDKDAKQNLDYPLKIYNPDKNTLEHLLASTSNLELVKKHIKGSGLHWLLCQTLLGDLTDNFSLKDFFSKPFADISYFKRFEGVKDDYEHIKMWLSLSKELLPEKVTYLDFKGVERVYNRLEALELMFQCAYMKLSPDDNTTLKSLLSRYGDFDELD